MSATGKPFVLRPLELKHLFDFSIRLYRFNFIPMFLSQAMVRLPMVLFSLPLLILFMKFNYQFTEMSKTGDFDMDFWLENAESLFVVGVIVLFGMVYQLLVTPLGNLTCAALATSAVEGEKLTFGEAFQFAKSKYWPTQVALATYLLPLLVVSVILLIIVLAFQVSGNETGVIATAFFALTVIMIGGWITSLFWFRLFPALNGVIQGAEEPEGEGIVAQGLWFLKRSYDLTKGHAVRAAGLLVLMLFGLGMISQGSRETVNVLAAIIEASRAGDQSMEGVLKIIEQPSLFSTGLTFALGSVLSLVLQPVWICYIVLVYLDIRCRKEAMDLFQLIRPAASSGDSADSTSS